MIDTVRAEYGKVAEAPSARSEADKQRLPLAQGARQCAQDAIGQAMSRHEPLFPGHACFALTIVGELVPYIDWTPFFQTWELRGRYPAILDDPQTGRGSARNLFDDAQAMLTRIVEEHWFDPKAVIGFWPANALATISPSIQANPAPRSARDLLHAAPAIVAA